MRALAFLVIAVLIALCSANFEGRGPDYQLTCSLGQSPDGVDINCPKPVLNGGWPAPFLFDQAGVSVEGRLSFIEDQIRWAPFVATVSFWFLICSLVGLIVRRLVGMVKLKPSA